MNKSRARMVWAAKKRRALIIKAKEQERELQRLRHAQAVYAMQRQYPSTLGELLAKKTVERNRSWLERLLGF